MGRNWTTVLVFGCISLVLGLAAVAWPTATLTVIAVLLGLQLFVYGIYSLARAASAEADGSRLAAALLGILALVIGVLVMRDGTRALTVLALLLGLFWFVGGALTVLAVLMGGPRPGRLLSLAAGVLGVVAGIIVLANPQVSLRVLAVILGLWLVVFGALTIATGFQMRSAERHGGRGHGRETADAAMPGH